jgi:acid stress-induced BolA-like protein IbaG/YrbA
MAQENERKIAEDLKNALEKNGIIITTYDYSVNGATGDITAYVTSGSFESKDEFQRQNLVWGAIKKDLPQDEYLHISGVIPLTPIEEEQHKD